jgi:hypothetical protein
MLNSLSITLLPAPQNGSHTYYPGKQDRQSRER